MCNNYAFYKQNVKSMKEQINPDKTAKKAIAFIESSLNHTQ
jgi:hypothetical protein